MENYNKPTPINFQGDLKKEWERFKKHFNCFLNAADLNHVSNARKTAIFLNLAGEKALDLVETFHLTDKDRHSYDIVVEHFEQYCSSPKALIPNRYRFHARIQSENETFEYYLGAVKKLAEDCDFGDQKESLIRDQIIFGMKSNDIRMKLLNYNNTGLRQVVEICRKYFSESSENGSSNGIISNDTKPRHVDPNIPYKCKKCGSKHKSGECIAYGHRCDFCNGMNHFPVGCKKKNFPFI